MYYLLTMEYLNNPLCIINTKLFVLWKYRPITYLPCTVLPFRYSYRYKIIFDGEASPVKGVECTSIPETLVSGEAKGSELILEYLVKRSGLGDP